MNSILAMAILKCWLDTQRDTGRQLNWPFSHGVRVGLYQLVNEYKGESLGPCLENWSNDAAHSTLKMLFTKIEWGEGRFLFQETVTGLQTPPHWSFFSEVRWLMKKDGSVEKLSYDEGLEGVLEWVPLSPPAPAGFSENWCHFHEPETVNNEPVFFSILPSFLCGPSPLWRNIGLAKKPIQDFLCKLQKPCEKSFGHPNL